MTETAAASRTKNRAHGTGHITEVVAGEKYRVRVTHGTRLNGKPRSVSETVKGTRAQAEARAAVLYEQLKNDTARGAGVTLEQYYTELFIPNKKKRGTTQANLNGYATAWKHTPERWKRQSLREPTHAELQAHLDGKEFRKELKNGRKVYHAGAAAQFLKYFKSILRAAWKDGLLNTQPLLLPFDIPNDNSTQEHARAWDEAETVAAWLLLRGHRLEAYALVAGAAGTRREETVALNWEDIEFKITQREGVAEVIARISITKALTEEDGEKNTKTTQSARIVPIAGYPARRLYEIRSTGAIVKTRAGGRLNVSGLRRQWLNLWNAPADLRYSRSRDTRHRAAGLFYERITRITINTLRHSNISLFSELGINDSTNMRYHGHAARTVETKHYIRRYDRALTEAAQRAAEAYEEAGEYALTEILGIL